MARKRLQAGKVPAKRKERVPVRQEPPEENEESEGKFFKVTNKKQSLTNHIQEL